MCNKDLFAVAGKTVTDAMSLGAKCLPKGTGVLLAWSFICLASVALAVDAPALGKVDFDRQVRPILSDHCFRCHGPDGGERKGNMRLDLPEGSTTPGDSGNAAVVPGKPDESELIARIFSDDASVQMPPPDINKPLSAEQKQILKRWISEGGKYEKHWSFVPPARPMKTPKLSAEQQKWARNPIDLLVQAKLDQAGLKPAVEADRAMLIRRLSLDLTGLLPEVEEVEAFLQDKSIDATERLVDRLMASPFYGERMALDWLDAARYADTHGYHIDSGRDMTRWREYVIDAFSHGMPYDQFTLEQLAGDLLPDVPNADENLRRKLASGFQRNNMINFEGGAIPQEYLTAYIIDRVNTLGTVYLGLTVACSQCHDHKYDPISQKDYYSLYAFFNSVPENGLDGSQGNAEPLMPAPTRQQTAMQSELDQEIADLEKQLASPSPKADAAQAAWEKVASAEGVLTWRTITATKMTAAGGANFQQESGILKATGVRAEKESYQVEFDTQGKPILAVRLTTLADKAFPQGGPGRSDNGNFVMTGVKVESQVSGSSEWKVVPIAEAVADFSQATYPVESLVNKSKGGGWAIFPETNKDHMAVFRLAEPIKGATGASKVRVTLEFNSNFSGHQPGTMRLDVTSISGAGLKDAVPADVSQALTKAAKDRTDAEHAALKSYYRRNISPEMMKVTEALQAAQGQKTALAGKIRSTMVMRDMANPRDTFILVRGAYDKPGEKVTANVPSFLPPLQQEGGPNRLGLAKWLIDPSHPLMTRVTVNRYWQMFFGTGLVKTVEDFGLQGDIPSHPELLDFLAVDFREGNGSADGGWDLKRLVRHLVNSSTYRQTSKGEMEQRKSDPENRNLARGSRFRLQAEFIRDNALEAGNLLNTKIGGNSVSPYQPAGIWEELASRADGDNWTAQKYTQSHGDDLYRRTMYTFWKRTAPPPSLMTFDAPDREMCTVRRARTNTPLQALVLMNDPTYVEASRHLAERVLHEKKNERERIEHLFMITLSRKPTGAEMAAVKTMLQKLQARYAAEPAEAEKLLSVGESARDASISTTELATWSMVCSAMMNLDEFVTRN